MEGFIDWNKLTIEQYIEHLENKFQFDSSGTAKAVLELIAAYRALTIHNVSNSLNLDELEAKLDEVLDKETPESLKQWLDSKRQ